MTGRLVVDGMAGLLRLSAEYGSLKRDPLGTASDGEFDDGEWLRMNAPRRLGGVISTPIEGDLGPDALTVTLRQLRGLLAGSEAPLKARLLDQGRIAGLGNLLVDETLLGGPASTPAGRAGSLDDDEVRRLHLEPIEATVGRLLGAGGLRTSGHAAVGPPTGGLCPEDGTPLERRTIGRRTTYSCPRHQRWRGPIS